MQVPRADGKHGDRVSEGTEHLAPRFDIPAGPGQRCVRASWRAFPGLAGANEIDDDGIENAGVRGECGGESLPGLDF